MTGLEKRTYEKRTHRQISMTVLNLKKEKIELPYPKRIPTKEKEEQFGRANSMLGTC